MAKHKLLQNLVPLGSFAQMAAWMRTPPLRYKEVVLTASGHLPPQTIGY